MKMIRKFCCATFCESDIVRMPLGDSQHPGGLGLTGQVGNKIGLKQTDDLLDIACGRGTSAVYLAEKFGCHFTGVDYSSDCIIAAQKQADSRGVKEKAFFQQGDTEELPFHDESFDAVISKCSFCTFPDKEKAAMEIYRVLKPLGRVGITDIILNGALPEKFPSVLSWTSCITGAATSDKYVAYLSQAGFADFTVEDKPGLLIEMTYEIRHKCLVMELVKGLRKIDLGINLQEANKFANQFQEW